MKPTSRWPASGNAFIAFDKAGDTVDLLLTAKRDLAAARRSLERTINLHGLPEKITIDKSGSNTAAIKVLMTMPALILNCGIRNI